MFTFPPEGVEVTYRWYNTYLECECAYYNEPCMKRVGWLWIEKSPSDISIFLNRKKLPR